MPIKELQFSFSISVEALAQALAQSNSGMTVQVLGTGPIAANDEPKQLPAPTKGARHLILAHAKKNPNKTYTVKEFIVFCANYGYQEQAVSSAIYAMRTMHLLRRVGPGQYRLTKGALNGRA